MMFFGALAAVGVTALLAAPPNVVLLSVDTLRADHLACYGYSYQTAPALDRLAGESLLFEDCVCEVPLTNPSFGALFASRYPRMTGTTRNGLRMPDGVPLLAEQFQAAGYQTMAVQSNWTLKHKLSGLGRGFERYEDNFHKKRWGILTSERCADEVTNVALELLRTRDEDRPLFFWAHYSDPHAPYRFHRQFNPQGKIAWQCRNPEMVRVKYDSEIAFMDYHIALLLDVLPRENTIILFTADHGESLHEHNYLGHGRRLYQDNLHVPLTIRGPGIAAGRSDTPACVLDIAPTLLALAGLMPAPGMLGRNLMAYIPKNRPRVVEAYGGAVPKLPGAKALLADSKPIRQSVIQDGWKLIIRGDGPELYHLDDDPQELNNLAAQMPERAAPFLKLIEGWTERYPHGQSQPITLSPDDVEVLRSLGYLE